jgi:CrcB protein
MPKLVLVGLGGCFGAIARYLCSGVAHRLCSGSLFPVGTLLVNVTGCFIIGLAMGLLEDKAGLAPSIRSLFVIGFLGSFTTFSSFGYETVELLRLSELLLAGLNILMNFILGFGAVFLGQMVVRAVVA